MTVGTEDYVEINEAVRHERVSYTPYWLRKLAAQGKIKARKVGGEVRGVWLISLPSLLRYVTIMDQLGKQKHNGHMEVEK